jgi:hypothetical protein
MKKLCALLLLLASSAHGQALFQLQKAGGGTTPTFTFVQNPITATCSTSSSTCALTGSSIGANHLLVIKSGTNTGAAVFIGSVTGNCSGTWQVPAGTQSAGGGSLNNLSDAYCLSSTSGAVAITVTWTSAAPGFNGAQLWEYSFTGSAAQLNTGASGGVGNVNNAAAATTQPGVALTLAGTTNLVIQQTSIGSGNTISSISTYGHFTSYFLGSGTNPGTTATADLENTASGTAPTWTFSGSTTSNGNAIAFTAVP